MRSLLKIRPGIGGSYNFDNLSIVLQGPAELKGEPSAALAILTARQAFPGAEIIVSCWDSDRTDSIRTLADQLVTSPDPGPQRYSSGVLNVNRQIISSRAGLAVATRPYVLKARSDLIFRDERLCREYVRQQMWFRPIHGRDPILITNLTTVNPRCHERYFALCDWIYLGPKELIADLLAAPAFPTEYLNHSVHGETVLRYNAEQWIAVNYLARHGLDLGLIPDGHIRGPSVARAHRELVGQHFALSSWWRLGLATQKHRISSFSLDKMYTQLEWAKEFQSHHSLMDLERMAITAAYHPFIRTTARRFLRSHGA